MSTLTKRWRLVSVALVALLVSLPAGAVDQTSLNALLEEIRVETKVPGLRAAVRFPDGKIVSASVGLAIVDPALALDDDIGMPGGSTGKTFVAALTMLLVEDGVLALSDPIDKWIGETSWYADIPNAESITVQHLLSHSSGLADYPGSVRFNSKMAWRAIRSGSAYFTPEELIDYAIARSERFLPGEGYAYTDAGYLVLGRVIESASGSSYFDLLQERILEPHGLSLIRPQNVSALPNIAHGYQGRASDIKKDGRMKFDPRSEWTGGGLVTTPTMLVQFLGALAEGNIVTSESLVRMTSSPSYRRPGESDVYYGFGLFVHDGGEWFGHEGRWAGYRSIMTHLPESGITIAVQTNRASGIHMPSVVRQIVAHIESQNE